MIEWSDDEKIILFQSLYSWLCEEKAFMDNVKNLFTLNVEEKELLLSNSQNKVKKIEIVIDKLLTM